jgi:chromosome segregation ATPase
MTNEELQAKLAEVENELAECRNTVEALLRENQEARMVTAFLMPLLPEIREKIKVTSLSQYKEKLEDLARRIGELPHP